MAKSYIKSWTFWFGLLQLALGAVGYFSGLMQPSEAITLMGTGATTIGLRFKTTAPITL